MALQSGQEVVLLSEHSSDATFQADSCAEADVVMGAPAAMPPTPGGIYKASGQPGSFTGPIVSGRFNSAAPATTKMPVTLTLGLPLFGSSPVLVPIVAAHLQLTYSGGRIVGGQINGGIKKSDIDNTLIPGIAQLLSQKILADKGNFTSTDMAILSLFDTGGTPVPSPSGCTKQCGNTCQNPANAPNACGCASANDSIIDECEVATNSIIQAVFAPDVQLFDANDNYAPNPQPIHKDSMSMGIAFTAIPAQF
jgi:hypothetical protein